MRKPWPVGSKARRTEIGYVNQPGNLGLRLGEQPGAAGKPSVACCQAGALSRRRGLAISVDGVYVHRMHRCTFCAVLRRRGAVPAAADRRRTAKVVQTEAFVALLALVYALW